MVSVSKVISSSALHPANPPSPQPSNHSQLSMSKSLTRNSMFVSPHFLLPPPGSCNKVSTTLIPSTPVSASMDVSVSPSGTSQINIPGFHLHSADKEMLVSGTLTSPLTPLTIMLSPLSHQQQALPPLLQRLFLLLQLLLQSK